MSGPRFCLVSIHPATNTCLPFFVFCISFSINFYLASSYLQLEFGILVSLHQTTKSCPSLGILYLYLYFTIIVYLLLVIGISASLHAPTTTYSLFRFYSRQWNMFVVMRKTKVQENVCQNLNWKASLAGKIWDSNFRPPTEVSPNVTVGIYIPLVSYIK